MRFLSRKKQQQPESAVKTENQNFAIYIDKCCQELEEAGYGSLKIEEFKTSVRNDRSEDAIEMKKRIELRTIEKDKSILEERIQRIEKGERYRTRKNNRNC